MMKIAAGLILLLVCIVSPAIVSQAWAQREGDWVLARWRGNVWWFPGVIAGVEDNSITVLYDDGTREKRPADQVKHYDWRVGSRVECDWKGGGKWYAGQITALSTGDVSVLYDDGDRENTRTGRCRSR